MNLNDFSKWLQYNKEWKIEGGLNTFRTHCISSTLPCIHCEVLFSPIWHFQAVSLSVFPCVYLDCLYDSDRLLPAFWPCLPFDILSVCRLPQPLHCPCCWFCLAFITPVTVSEPCLFDLLLFINKAAFGSNDTASSLQKYSEKNLLPLASYTDAVLVPYLRVPSTFLCITVLFHIIQCVTSISCSTYIGLL